MAPYLSGRGLCLPTQYVERAFLLALCRHQDVGRFKYWNDPELHFLLSSLYATYKFVVGQVEKFQTVA